jgi:hypothetical protein
MTIFVYPAHKLESLRQLFPQAVEVDNRGNIRVNAAAMQMAMPSL